MSAVGILLWRPRHGVHVGDEHANGLGVKGDKAVRVLPDVVHYAVQPCLCLHQDENLAEQYENIISIQIEGDTQYLRDWFEIEGRSDPKVVLELVLHCVAPWSVPDLEASIAGEEHLRALCHT